MSRITKQLAEFVTNKMTEAKKDLISQKQSQLDGFIIAEYYKTLPDKIVKIFRDKELKKFIDTKKSLQFGGTFGLGYNTMYFSEYFPYDGTQRAFCPTKEASEKIILLQREIDQLGEQYNELWDGIFYALLALKTYKNVEREFPEALEHLPEVEKSSAIMLNIGALREKLK